MSTRPRPGMSAAPLPTDLELDHQTFQRRAAATIDAQHTSALHDLATHLLPHVTVPRHMLEDTPPTIGEQLRAAMHAHQADQLATYNDAHPGRHAHPYDPTTEALRWNPRHFPRHLAF